MTRDQDQEALHEKEQVHTCGTSDARRCVYESALMVIGTGQ